MMSLNLENPTITAQEIIDFISQVFSQQHKSTALVAVSGGIDSALTLTLVTKALSKENVIPVFLPYGDQSMVNAQLMTTFVEIGDEQVIKLDILPIVEAAANQLQLDEGEVVRRGNLMARARMMVLFDLAKKHHGLVCGTENKSEKYLGYFTRFGDAAADVDPISHLYKTQVRQLAQHFNLPAKIIDQPPSAGLWRDQTDEAELGFSYEHADLVMHQLFDLKKPPAHIEGVESDVIEKVRQRLEKANFKQQVPYKITS